MGSEFTINNSVKISDITGFGKTTIGFLLVGLATSLPELSVSIFAVANPENVGVSLGNVLGSNIVNIALVLGVCILIIVLKRPRYPSFLLTIAKEEMGNLHFGLFIASIIPLALLYIGYASRFIGVILLGIFIFYTIQLARSKRTKLESTEVQVSERSKMRRYTLIAVAGAVVVIATAFFIVESSSFIALSVGIPRVVIGATIVAFGTSIPELATSLVGVFKKEHHLAVGNVIGSNIFNLTAVLLPTCFLGLTQPIDPLLFSRDLPVMLGFSLLFLLMSQHKKKIFHVSRWEGGILFLSYIGYITFLVLTI